VTGSIVKAWMSSYVQHKSHPFPGRTGNRFICQYVP